jgi:hypothetical protein
VILEKTAFRPILALALALGGGCKDSRPKAPAHGTYGQITNLPASRILLAHPPKPLTFDAPTRLTCVQTELSPAVLFHAKTNYIGFFTELERGGLAAPSYAAVSTRNGPRAFRNGERIEAADLEENWVLAWFAGARGWTNGDCPSVIYLQRKPRRMVLDTNGLHFYFAGEAGDTVLLPLYGSYRPPAEGKASNMTFGGKKVQTWQWPKVLTREPLMRVRYWASALREFPIYCEETFSVDRSTDSVTIRQKFVYHAIDDDWGTKHLKLNPISPTLGLALKDRQFPVQFSRQVRDLEMPTPVGLYRAAEGEEPLEATFFVLQHINEERKTTLLSASTNRGADAWAHWSPPEDCIDRARRAYRAGEVDGYNYGCYLFARLFAKQGVTSEAAAERLIPSGRPAPFVPGIEREMRGCNPPLLQSIENGTGAWPRVICGNEWILGQVKVAGGAPAAEVVRVTVNWNTEALLFFP